MRAVTGCLVLYEHLEPPQILRGVSPSLIQGMLAGSRNIHISGGNFVEQHVSSGIQEIAILHSHIAVGALHDSGERFNPPRCHPRTRGALLAEIMTWITKVDRQTFILWLNGSAGSGKSALAQSIAEQCRDLGLLTASFFFSRLHSDQCHEKLLSSTISYQLALSIPQSRVYIEDVIRFDPSIFGKTFQTQFQKLVVGPACLAAKQTGGEQEKRPQLVIIDGLDECQDPKAQRYILDVISQEFQRCPHLPLVFMITSRPEEHLRMSFNSGTLKRISHQLPLEDYFGAHDDIRIFIQNGFKEIKHDHPLREHIPSTWPSQEVIETLVQNSSGQFIYASIVVEYVSSIQHRPPERLNVILGLSHNSGDSPFSELDALYKHVFSPIIYKKQALRILSAVLLMDIQLSPEEAENFLSLKPGDVRLYLGGLASLVGFQDSQKKIKVLHAPLRDFLLDPARSRDLCIDVEEAHAYIAAACLRQLYILGLPTLVDYACYNFETHFDSAGETDELKLAIRTFRLDKFHRSVTTSLYQRHDLELDVGLEDLWYFIPTFFDCIGNTVIYEDAQDIHDHHVELFDQYLSRELDKYTGDRRLQDLVTMLTICHSPVTVENLEGIPFFKDAILQLNSATAEHLVLIDESSLNLRHMVRRHTQSEPYIELVCQFLEDRSRAGRHFVDGEKYAQAAFRCSKRVSKPTSSSEDERNVASFIWSLECLPPLLLYAGYHEDLVSFLEGSFLGTITHAQSLYSFYPSLARMVKDARIAYLISSSFELKRNYPCNRRAAQLCLVPQGIKIIPNRSESNLAPHTENRLSSLGFENLLLLPQLAATLSCCCQHLLVNYVGSQISDFGDHHPRFHSSRAADLPNFIVHIEHPFPEISAEDSSLPRTSSGDDLTPTVAGVMTILAYRIWRDMIQSSDR